MREKEACVWMGLYDVNVRLAMGWFQMERHPGRGPNDERIDDSYYFNPGSSIHSINVYQEATAFLVVG